MMFIKPTKYFSIVQYLKNKFNGLIRLFVVYEIIFLCRMFHKEFWDFKEKEINQ